MQLILAHSNKTS